MVFSMKKFEKNASREELKRVPKSHRIALDGKELNERGEIDYEVDGQEYYLYPVLKEWMEEGYSQLELMFD